MIEFTRYNFITGQIMTTGTCDTISVFQQALNDEEHVLIGAKLDGSAIFMPGGVQETRPDLAVEDSYSIAADGVAAVELAFPVPCDIEDLATGEMFTGETSFYFASEETGFFRYRIYPAFPYKVREVSIHVS